MNMRESIGRLNIHIYMITFLLILITINIITFGVTNTVPQVIIAAISASAFDTAIKYFKNKKIGLSKSGLITGLLIGSVLGTGQPWHIPLAASAIAIAVKNIVKIKRTHIFNPAASGILLSTIFFSTSTGWWAALPLYLVVLLGAILTWKTKSYYQVLPFIVSYLMIQSALSLSMTQPLMDSTLWFFAFFMLPEPKTSPYNKKGRILYGIILAALATLFAAYVPQLDPLLLGLIAANATVPLLRSFVK